MREKINNAREAYRPALSLPQASWSQCWIGLQIHENKQQSKTPHETPRSNNHKATQNKNNTTTIALELSVA